VTEGRREDECGCRGGQGAEERNGGSGSRVSAIGPQTTPRAGSGILVQVSRELWTRVDRERTKR
jgi:hypothetical protein